MARSSTHRLAPLALIDAELRVRGTSVDQWALSHATTPAQVAAALEEPPRSCPPVVAELADDLGISMAALQDLVAAAA